MHQFDKDGFLIIPDPRDYRKKEERKEIVAVTQVFCHNGHSLIWGNARFNGLSGIHLLVENAGGARGDMAISPIYGDKSYITLGIELTAGEKVKLLCPVCKEELPILQPCDECKNGNIRLLFCSEDADEQNAIGFCDVVDCPNAVLISAGQLISERMLEADDGSPY